MVPRTRGSEGLAPEEFGGPGDAWTPEHLLLASVETCFLFTLRAVAHRSKLTFNALEVDVNGIVDRQDGITRFTEIVVRARVAVPPGTDRDLVARIMDKAERACLVTASQSTPVRLEPTIVIG